MKIIVVLFMVINFFACDFNSLNYKSDTENESAVGTPTPIGNLICLEKDYQPKSEIALATMTSRQLIDELVKINPDSFKTYSEVADYEKSIEIKIREAGVESLAVLTEYMNDYEPQSVSKCNEHRFAVVKRLVYDIDRFEFRLRGTKEGKLTINAFDRAIERMEKSNKSIPEYRNLFLSQIKGINFADEAIQDTFWVDKKIEISDSEMLEFSNFLIIRDPTYPSWSDKDFIKDYSRINQAGNPSQVYILKKPERFYEVYTEFKKIKH
jgi:hypothetical protein